MHLIFVKGHTLLHERIQTVIYGYMIDFKSVCLRLLNKNIYLLSVSL